MTIEQKHQTVKGCMWVVSIAMLCTLIRIPLSQQMISLIRGTLLFIATGLMALKNNYAQNEQLIYSKPCMLAGLFSAILFIAQIFI